MSRKRKVRHELVVKYALKHGEMSSADIAHHFRLSARHVREILHTAGIQSGACAAGRPPVLKNGQTTDQNYWEKLLTKLGLGMDSGVRIGNQRIFLGYDTLLSTASDESVTSESAG